MTKLNELKQTQEKVQVNNVVVQSDKQAFEAAAAAHKAAQEQQVTLRKGKKNGS